MPCYPALALLLGCSMATQDNWVRYGTRALGVLAAIGAIATIAIAFYVRNLPTPGDISSALSSNPSAYTLSLGHMLDLTLDSFAYLRLPLIMVRASLIPDWSGRYPNVRNPARWPFFLTGAP